MTPTDLHGLEVLIRLQTRAIQDYARRLEAAEKELAGCRAESKQTAAVITALLDQLQKSQTSSLLGWADRNPWPAFGLVLLLALFLTNQLYLLPLMAPAVGGLRAAP